MNRRAFCALPLLALTRPAKAAPTPANLADCFVRLEMAQLELADAIAVLKLQLRQCADEWREMDAQIQETMKCFDRLKAKGL